MEPNNLNFPPPDDVQLEAWLRTSASLPPLPGDGFTSRVVATLPVPVARRSTQRLWVCAAGAFVGLVVAALKISTAPDLELSVPALTPDATRSLEQLSDPMLAIAVAITVASLTYVFWSDLRRLIQIR